MSRIAVTIEGRTYNVELPALTGYEEAIEATVDDVKVRIELPNPGLGDWALVDGRSHEFLFDNDLGWVRTPAGLHTLDIRDLDAVVSRPVTGDGRLKAPIPGLVSRIWVTVGQQVEIGDPIMTLEAMKMQNELRAARAGVVSYLHVEPGQTVTKAQVLAEIEDQPAST